MINNADLFSQPSLIIFTKGTNNSDHVCSYLSAHPSLYTPSILLSIRSSVSIYPSIHPSSLYIYPSVLLPIYTISIPLSSIFYVCTVHVEELTIKLYNKTLLDLLDLTWLIYPSIFCLSIHPFNHPFVIYPPIHPSSLYSYPSTHLSIYLSILNQFIIYHLSIHPSIFCLSIHPTIQAIHPFIICPSTQPHLHPSSVYLSIVVSIYTVKSVLYPKRMLQVVMSNVIWYVSKIVFGMTESTCIP